MDVRLLEAFRNVMTNRSVTAAARVMGLTQPAVSAQIARLESLVGFALFERVGGRLRPTEQGRRFHDEVTRALGMIDRLQQVSESIRTGRESKIVVAAHPSASISVLPELAARFTRSRPGVQVKMINRTSAEVRNIFEAASVDVGIAELPIDLSGIEVRRHMLRCVVVLPTNHALAAQQTVTARDISGEPFIALAHGRLIDHRIRNALLGAGAELNTVAEVEYFSSACGMVAAGMGVSVVDCWSADTFRFLGLEVRPLAPAIDYEVGVFYSTDRPPNALARMFIDMLDDKLKSGPAYLDTMQS